LLQSAGVELVHVSTPRGKIHLPSVLDELGRREILSLLLESGPGLNTSALESSIVDKLYLFYAPLVSGKATVPFARSPFTLSTLGKVQFHQFGRDLVIEGYLRDVYQK
jgi:diaminohydroxyphosphoribosylaminopyrimidine deaminase/5-amino-6-(5-phosphoribosylamino)uracil reductase